MAVYLYFWNRLKTIAGFNNGYNLSVTLLCEFIWSFDVEDCFILLMSEYL